MTNFETRQLSPIDIEATEAARGNFETMLQELSQTQLLIDDSLDTISVQSIKELVLWAQERYSDRVIVPSDLVKKYQLRIALKGAGIPDISEVDHYTISQACILDMIEDALINSSMDFRGECLELSGDNKDTEILGGIRVHTPEAFEELFRRSYKLGRYEAENFVDYPTDYKGRFKDKLLSVHPHLPRDYYE